MSLTLPKESGGDFELPPADTHIATCYRIIDLGTQQIEWQNEVKHQHKIMLSWELNAAMSDGRPFSIHKRYTFSSHEKANMRQDLEAWRGVPFTAEDMGNFKLANLLGKSCLMGIIHSTKNGKTYANISSIMRLPKGMEPPKLVNELLEFDLSHFDADVFAKLSQGIRDTISKSPEYAQAIRHRDKPDEGVMVGHMRGQSMIDDEIPF